MRAFGRGCLGNVRIQAAANARLRRHLLPLCLNALHRLVRKPAWVRPRQWSFCSIPFADLPNVRLGAMTVFDRSGCRARFRVGAQA